MYEKLGGRTGINEIVDDFYRIMATDPAAREVHATHTGRELADSAKKLKAFLSGWTGGPQDYLETYGHPRLRMRHNAFTITKVEADQWHTCMRKALALSPVEKDVQELILKSFEEVTQMLINSQG
mgnify:CR=1 FL=1